MPALIVLLIALIVGGAGFVGGTYYGEKVQKNKTSAQSETTAIASSTATVSSRSGATATQTAVAQGIKVTSPAKDATVSSPLTITGEAVGSRYFEGEFTVSMVDGNGAEVASAIAKAQGDWMSENYVPFTATMDFKKQLTPFGYLVFKKNNPSGQPPNDQEYRLKVNF